MVGCEGGGLWGEDVAGDGGERVGVGEAADIRVWDVCDG